MSQSLEKTPITGTIIQVGATEFPDIPSSAPPTLKIILVEPDENLLRTLGLDRDRPGLTVIKAALSDQDGTQDLKVFNLPGLSSLHRPEVLQELYPGLRVIRRAPTAVICPATLFADLGELPAPRTLVLRTTGSESRVIDSLQDAGLLTRFSRIDIRTGTEPLFEGSKTMAAIADQLIGAGFQLAGQDNSDSDWPTWSFGLDPQAVEIAALKRDLTAARAREAELGEKLATLEATHKEVTDKANWRLKRIKELEIEQAALVAAHKEITDKAGWQQKRIEELQTAEDTGQRERDKALTDLSLALRMQTLSANDLDELRHSYARLQEQKERQDILISQLVMRLEEASGYLQAATVQDPSAVVSDFLEQASEAVKVKSKPAKKAKSKPKAGAKK